MRLAADPVKGWDQKATSEMHEDGVGDFGLSSPREVAGNMTFIAKWPADMGNVHTVGIEPRDADGRQFFPGFSCSGPDSKDGHRFLSFTGIPASKLSEVAIRLTHYDEAVQFRNICLTPGQKTEVQISITSDDMPPIAYPAVATPISASEFESRYKSVGQIGTMKNTEYLGLRDGRAFLRIGVMSLFEKWSERIVYTKTSDFDGAFLAALPRKEMTEAQVTVSEAGK